MGQLEITLTVTATTPLSVGAGGSAGTLADKVIVRDGWNRPIIPGSQVKGKVRHAAEMLVNGLEFPHVQQHFDDDTSKENVIRTLFGSPRHRSPLFFSDLVGVFGNTDQIAELRERPEQQRSQIRPAVAINRRRGVADDARLLFQETTLEEMRFYAAPAIRGEVPDREHAALLWAALRLTTRWGSASSRGLGWSTIAVAVAWDGTPLEADDQLYTALRALVEREVQRT